MKEGKQVAVVKKILINTVERFDKALKQDRPNLIIHASYIFRFGKNQRWVRRLVQLCTPMSTLKIPVISSPPFCTYSALIRTLLSTVGAIGPLPDLATEQDTFKKNNARRNDYFKM